MAAIGKLSIDRLKDALESFDWPKVKAVLDEAGGPNASSIGIGEALRRAGDLVFQYPSALEKRRDALVLELQSYLAGEQTDGKVPSPVAEALSTLQVAEAGYRKLVGELAKTAASRLEPTVHVAAAIQRAETEVEHLTAEFHKQAGQRNGITLQAHLLDEYGNPFDMDSALENFVDFVSMTLKMEAFKNKWLDQNGHVVVPNLPEVTEEAVYQAGSTLFLAILWRRWAMTEERARVLGRTLRFLGEDERPKEAPANLVRFLVEEGDDFSDWMHRIAQERVTDKLSQNLVEIGATLNISRQRAQAPGGVRALPPNDWISNEEAHGIWGLRQYLAYEVVADQERHGGLRLVEWVRGYCALMLLARGAKPGNLVRTRAGWQDYLASYGLAAEPSEVLISRLTFGRSSRDLFDHPFIKLADGRYRLFATALRSVSVPIVVLSTLSHLSVQLKLKGKAFEEIVRTTFEKAGIKPYSFKAKRGEEEYEYDAVVPWGNYLFVIECKNRSLPFGSAVQMHFFDLETRDNIRQVHRLMKGLDEHPDILTSNLPAGAETKTRVPVIINCFPFSSAGKVNGVYLYDYSALSRFFESGEIMMKSVAPGKWVQEQGTGIRLWAKDAPQPEDLIAQLEMPSQLENVMRSLERDPRGFPLPPDWWAFGVSFVRNESTTLKNATAKAATEPSVEQKQG